MATAASLVAALEAEISEIPEPLAEILRMRFRDVLALAVAGGEA